jgi:hypothetical protein
MLLGLAYETRARAALALGDEAGFRAFAERCAAQYRGRGNPALDAKYQRLIEQARERGVPAPASFEHAVPAAAVMQEARRASELKRRLASLGSARERQQAALGSVVELAGARGGLLLALRGGRLELLAATPGEAPPSDLAERLRAQLETNRGLLAAQTESDDPGAAPEAPSLLDAERRPLRTLLLPSWRGAAREVPFVAVLREAPGSRAPIELGLLEAIADALLEQAALDPLTRVA